MTLSRDQLHRSEAIVRVLSDWSQNSQGASHLAAIEELRGLAASLQRLSIPEQLIARGFVSHQLAKISLSWEQYPDLASALVAMMASPWGEDEWIALCARIAGRLEAAIKDHNDVGSGRSPREVRVAKALHFIEANFADPELTLQRVADQVGLSFSYLAHSFKEHTGHGFIAHLRQRRVEAARRLLEQTVLSVKEVAAATGYQTPRHLERDFKRIIGIVPTAIRRSAPNSKAA